jgi:hypothetical protein
MKKLFQNLHFHLVLSTLFTAMSMPRFLGLGPKTDMGFAEGIGAAFGQGYLAWIYGALIAGLIYLVLKLFRKTPVYRSLFIKALIPLQFVALFMATGNAFLYWATVSQ